MWSAYRFHVPREISYLCYTKYERATMQNIKTLNIGKLLQHQTPNPKQNCNLRSQNMNSKQRSHTIIMRRYQTPIRIKQFKCIHSQSYSHSPRIRGPKIADSMRTMDQKYSLYPERISRFYEFIIELDWVFDVEHLQFKGIKTYQISNDHLIHYSSWSFVFCIVPSCQPSTTNIQQLSINIQINLCTMKGSKATST